MLVLLLFSEDRLRICKKVQRNWGVKGRVREIFPVLVGVKVEHEIDICKVLIQ